MTATADIVTATVEDALLLPNEALRFVPPKETKDDRSLLQRLFPFGRRRADEDEPPAATGSRRTVHRLVDGRPSPVEVEVGLSDGTRTEVKGTGLAEGDPLVVDVESGTEP